MPTATATRPRLLAGAVLLAAITAGCATEAELPAPTDAEAPGEHAHDDASPAQLGARTVQVSAGDLAFGPGNVEMHVGEAVNLALSSTDTLHDLTIDEIGFHVAADVGELSTGAAAFDRAGTYIAYCSVPGHREAGMELRITVG